MWKQVMPGVFEGVPGSEIDGDTYIRHIRLSNIPPETEETHRFWSFKSRDGTKSGFEAATFFGKDKVQLPFLALLGTSGTGKTHLALAIAWEWLEEGKTVLYYHVTAFLNALRDGFKRSGENDYFHISSFAQNCSLLILDDLGAEKETEWATEQLDLIVDYRYERHKALIVTSNLALNELSARIADRLKEGKIVQVKGESYRKQKREKV